VCITTDTRDASDPKIKWRECIFTTFPISQTGLFEIGHNEAAKTAINVKPNFVRGGQSTKSYYVVLVAVWEVDGGAYELGDII